MQYSRHSEIPLNRTSTTTNKRNHSTLCMRLFICSAGMGMPKRRLTNTICIIFLVFSTTSFDKQSALPKINFMHIHIGRLIREELRRQGHTNEWFMERIGMSERTLQRLFHKPSLDTHQLFRISSILGTNFFQHYSGAIDAQLDDNARQCLSTNEYPT